ncbi:PspC family transcriptional regulator [Paenibacillus albidus]|uniref:PspC family transcriptional regulator n=1 Tax=Paenibacillus albidus TaxID=2041023 RepID=A0A917CAR4_9BACL|nr:PspC domain-containing protein [Paenibacillus albidus]MBT2289715.1 PspC domain-containing protein [Paenibacillus albidus]GGF81255.1 PspC family transcriptional regulator [Paenibacillus albidus]
MKKLFRSRSDKRISGLCGGLAQYLGIDATILRLAALIATLFSFGTIILIYVIGSIIVPLDNYSSFSEDPHFY